MCNSTESSTSIDISMETGHLNVYLMDGEASSLHPCTEEYQEPACSPEDCCNQASCSADPFYYASPITSAQAVDAPLAMDIVRTMHRQESAIYHHPISHYVDQAKHGTSCLNQSRRKNVETMDSWRSSLIQWMYQVADFSHVRKESVGVAVYFLDVAIKEIIVGAMNRNQLHNSRTHSLEDYKVSFQLAAATALQLAIKTHDCKLIKLQDLVVLGRNAFTERDIVRLEVQIIEACGWYLHPPSVYCYLHQYQSLLFDMLQQDDSGSFKLKYLEVEDAKTTITKLVNTMAELILPQAQFKAYPPSIVAYAIILVATASVKSAVIPLQQLQRLSRQLSLALILHEDDNNAKKSFNIPTTRQQHQDQQFLLLQTIQKVQACCQSSSHLDFVASLQDMVILKSIEGKPSKGTFSLVCLVMDDYVKYTAPKTPPKGAVMHTIIAQANSDSSPESPVSVMDDFAQLQLYAQHEQPL